MKRIVKTLGAVSLGILFLFYTCNQVSAKNFYDTKFNNQNTKKPYKKVNKKIAKIAAGDYMGDGRGYRFSCRKDFNGDGKKEKVVLSANASKYNDNIVLTINSKVAIVRKGLGSYYNSTLSTMKVQGKCLAVLMYGDEDYASGGALIYLWKNNHNLKLLMEYRSKGYLRIYNGKDKVLNKNVLYIEDSQQLPADKKWPKNVLKRYRRYKKYTNKKSISVTKSTYQKFVYKNGGLKKVGKDNYFRVGIGYD